MDRHAEDELNIGCFKSQNLIRATLCGCGASNRDLDDLVQDVLLRIVSSADGCAVLAAFGRNDKQHDGTKPTTIICYRSRLAFYDWLRRKVRRPIECEVDAPLEIPMDEPTSDQLLGTKEEAEAMRRHLRQQNPVIADTVDRRISGGLTLKEIADKDGVSIETVRQRFKKGVETLRDFFDPRTGTSDLPAGGMDL